MKRYRGKPPPKRPYSHSLESHGALTPFGAPSPVPRRARTQANTAKLAEALRLLHEDGVLFCDEIDLLLHPLRSELNFPIGEKHDLDFR